MDRLVHDDRAERGAALPGGAETGEERTLHRKIEIGARGHDQRILAAQLQAGGLQMAPGQRADLAADRGGSGETDLVDQPGLQRLLQAGERRGAVGVHDVENAVRQPAAADEEFVERRAADC